MVRWGARRKLYGLHGETPLTGESQILVRKPHRERQRPITDAELEALYRQCETHDRADETDPEGPIRLRAYIELALITCLRLTELYRLRWSDVTSAFYPGAARGHQSGDGAPTGAARCPGRGLARVPAAGPAGRPYPETASVFGRCGNPPVDINDAFNTLLLRAFPARDAAGQALPREARPGLPSAAG